MTKTKKHWKVYQDEFKDYYWHCTSECPKNHSYIEDYDKPFDLLIGNSNPIKSEKFTLCTYFQADSCLNFTFGLDTEYGKSAIWISGSMQDINGLWTLLEALCSDNETKEFYYYADEEDFESYFYITKIDKDNIRFVHIANSTWTFNNFYRDKDIKRHYIDDEDEPFAIKQDIIVNKNQFIFSFYRELLWVFDFMKDQEVTEPYLIDDYKTIQKTSEIVRKYLKKLKNLYKWC